MISREEMIEALQKGVCRVRFTKVNGHTRLMYCTLNPDVLPRKDVMVEQAGFNPKKQVNEKVLAVWDIDVKAWRSFRIDSISMFETPE